MIDLARFAQDAMAGFDQPEQVGFPLSAGKQESGGNSQTIDPKHVSHCSHLSHARNGHSANPDQNPELMMLSAWVGPRARRLCAEQVGKVGMMRTPLKSNGIPFPPSTKKVGMVGKGRPAGRSPYPDAPEGWRDAFYALNSDVPPCPGFKGRHGSEWREVFDAAHAFLEQHAETAHALGWRALDIFAVHRAVGAVRVDCCGALMVGGSAIVTRVDAAKIHFSRDGKPCGRFPRTPASSEAILIWEYDR